MNTIDGGISGDTRIAGGMVSRRTSRQLGDYVLEDYALATEDMMRNAQQQQRMIRNSTVATNTRGRMENNVSTDSDLERGRTSSVSIDDGRPQLDTLYSGFTPPQPPYSDTTTESSLTSRRTSETGSSDNLETFQCAAMDGSTGHLEQHYVDAQTEGKPINFGTVIPGVYRSSYPQTEDYPFLQKLGLKTVV